MPLPHLDIGPAFLKISIQRGQMRQIILETDRKRCYDCPTAIGEALLRDIKCTIKRAIWIGQKSQFNILCALYKRANIDSWRQRFDHDSSRPPARGGMSLPYLSHIQSTV
jgi:hypothetical protein